jgi:predicted metalloprotease
VPLGVAGGGIGTVILLLAALFFGFEKGDVEEALNAASAIGDDRLQQRSPGCVAPDTFTHGSGAQRVRWFRRGLESGQIKQCDTFAAPQL